MCRLHKPFPAVWEEFCLSRLGGTPHRNSIAYVQIHTHVHMYVCMHVCMYVKVYIYIHVLIR